MRLNRIKYLALFFASGVNFSALAEVPGATHSSLGPESVTTQTRINCKSTSYLIEYESTQGIEAVRLIKFTKTPDGVEGEVVQKLSDEFAKFQTITFFDAWCGKKKNGLPKEFLDLEIRGSYVAPVSKARKDCAEKGWNFDRLTRRKFLIAEGDIEISGKRIGYCSGEMKYFEMKIPLAKEENE